MTLYSSRAGRKCPATEQQRYRHQSTWKRAASWHYRGSALADPWAAQQRRMLRGRPGHGLTAHAFYALARRNPAPATWDRGRLSRSRVKAAADCHDPLDRDERRAETRGVLRSNRPI